MWVETAMSGWEPEDGDDDTNAFCLALREVMDALNRKADQLSEGRFGR